ncbi:MAG: hypothetical protein HFE63_09640 [Clostridiales bacterium]|nr:hypothetical protein [Clostridiales bacterium]
MFKNKTARILCALILAGAATLSFAACEDTSKDNDTPNVTDNDDQNKLTGDFATVSKSFNFTKLGESAILTSTVGGTEVYDVTYTSADPAVADVIGNALVATGNGTTTITASYNGKEDIIMVTVATAAKVSIDGDRMVSLNTDSKKSANLTATVSVPTIYDNDAAGVTWTSNNPDVATVDANGVVTAVSAGVAQITASSNYQITTSSTQTVMGMTITNSESLISDDVIVVMVNNEFDAKANADLIGTYEGHYDWQGFAAQASESNPIYTKDNFLWIRSKIVLELKEDGSFTQHVYNAQRATYPESIDESLPESTYEEQVAKYGKNNCYIYNAYDQDPASDEFASENDKTFAAIDGMVSRGANNFAESGYFMILDGNLVLYYGQTNGMTGEYQTSEFVYGPVAGAEFTNNVYTPFKNMVAMSDNMAVTLAKAAN